MEDLIISRNSAEKTRASRTDRQSYTLQESSTSNNEKLDGDITAVPFNETAGPTVEVLPENDLLLRLTSELVSSVCCPFAIVFSMIDFAFSSTPRNANSSPEQAYPDILLFSPRRRHCRR